MEALSNFEELMQKARNQIEEWSEQVGRLAALQSSNDVNFDDTIEYVSDRLMSPACLKNQGYVMSDFQLNREMASLLFLDNNRQSEFNELTKPDYVIILNKTMDRDDECAKIEELLLNKENDREMDESVKMQLTLRNY